VLQAGWGVLGLWVGLSIGLIIIGVVLLVVWHRKSRAWNVSRVSA
jgi:Na+-driven multidrug efflux pump